MMAKRVDLEAAMRKVNAGYPQTQRHELEWLIRDLVAEARSARRVVESLRIETDQHTCGDPEHHTPGICSMCEAVAAYDQAVGGDR